MLVRSGSDFGIPIGKRLRVLQGAHCVLNKVFRENSAAVWRFRFPQQSLNYLFVNYPHGAADAVHVSARNGDRKSQTALRTCF